MNKTILCLIAMYVSASILKGESPSKGTMTPYSFYGFGKKNFNGPVENISMGGVGISQYNPFLLNLSNPASLSKIQFTNFSLGGFYTQYNFRQNDKSRYDYTIYLNNISLGFPLIEEKLGIVMSLVPYSSMGYKHTITDEKDTTNTIRQALEGSGGLNSLMLGLGYSVTNEFRVGMNVNYIFGNVNRLAYYSEEALDMSSVLDNSYVMSGVNFDFGLQGTRNIAEELNISYGLVYKMGNYLSTKIKKELYTMNKNVGYLDSSKASYFSEERREKINLNNELNIELGIGDMKKWNVGMLYSIILANASKKIIDYKAQDVEYVGGYKFSLGGYITPTNNYYRNYYERITYRLGAFIEKDDIKVRGINMYDKGITFGLSMPFKMISFVNLSCVIGSYGALENNLVKDSYWKIYLSINFNDKWFVKYKYD